LFISSRYYWSLITYRPYFCDLELFEMVLLRIYKNICTLIVYSLVLKRKLAVVKPYLLYDLMNFATELDMNFNSSESLVMQIGDRYKVKCEPLMLAGCELQFLQSLKYLGVQFVASKKLKCSVHNIRLKFCRSFDAIYSRSKGSRSELVTLQPFKSYCLVLILYATEVLPLSKHSLNTLDFCVSQAVAKIFKTHDIHCINQIRLACDLSDVNVLIERHRMKFVNNMLDSDHLHCFALFCVNC